MKICPVGAELFQAKRQMERHDKDNITKIIVNFAIFPMHLKNKSVNYV